MSRINSLHEKAMDFADKADSARSAGDDSSADKLYRKAFEHERRAALMVKESLEPTRSVLLRSAATLAMECGEFIAAEQLICRGLSGWPPEELRAELLQLFDQVNFQRHLALSDSKITRTEFEFVLNGAAVSEGLAPATDYLTRAAAIDAMLVRTVERQSAQPFREGGKPSKLIDEEFQRYFAVPHAASFGVRIRIGRRVHQKRLFDSEFDVVSEFLTCIQLFTEERKDELQAHIQDEAYFRNFVAHAKKIQPDGSRISMVGFAARSGNRVREVAMRGRTQISWALGVPSGAESVVVTGVLVEAKKQDKWDTIGLQTDEGERKTIRVPPGLMADIVRPHWERRVTVEGVRKGTVITLEDIHEESHLEPAS